jgi:nucleotide-binding universal stress UspA family protein
LSEIRTGRYIFCLFVTVGIVVGVARWLKPDHLLDRVANAAKQDGVSCDTVHVQDVQRYEAIVAMATDRGCDLIVMASHGSGGLSAVVLGSVTNKVLTHAKTPVLVCQ